MTNETTHDDIINKEIEEEHEFMRARIKELENKPTYPFNEAFNKQLQEENAKLKQELKMRKANEQESDEFWDGVFDKDYPFNKENAYKELADYYFFLQQIPKIYHEITGGTLSKTNYFASSVILAYRDNCERCQEKQEQENKNFEKQLQEENAKLKQECKNLEEELRGCRISIKDISIESTEICKISEKYKQALDEIEKLAKENVELLEGYHLEQANCLTISEIINQAKEYKTMNTNEPNQKEKKFIYGESKGCTAIYAVDEPSPNNNSYHEFIINYEPDSKTSELLGRINLQNGNFAEFGHNGIFTEHLLIIARDCLERFNTSKYACQENTLAINNINHALMWLNKRTTERVKRGVYGTETV